MTSQPPRDYIDSSSDITDAIGVRGEVGGSDQVIGDSNVIQPQFFSTGYGAAITALQLDDVHRFFLNRIDFEVPQNNLEVLND